MKARPSNDLIFQALQKINEFKTTPNSSDVWNTATSISWRASILYILSLGEKENPLSDPDIIKETLVSILAYPFTISDNCQNSRNELLSLFTNQSNAQKSTAESYIEKSVFLGVSIHQPSENDPHLITYEEHKFMVTIEALTSMLRFQTKSYWPNYTLRTRFDTVSEHSWALAVSIYIMEQYKLVSLNMKELLTLMIMAIIHDLEESTTDDKCPIGDEHGNDTHAFNEQKRQEKDNEAKKAFQELSEILPPKKQVLMRQLFLSTFHQENPIVILLKAIDTLEACFQIQAMTNWNLDPQHLDWSKRYTIDRCKKTEQTVQEFIHYCLERFTAII